MKVADESLVLSIEPGVPVYFGKIELVLATTERESDVHIIWSSQNFVRERSVYVVAADVLGLVDHGTDVGILVQEYLPDQVPIRLILLPQIQMGWLARQPKILKSRLVDGKVYVTAFGLTYMSSNRKAGRSFLLVLAKFWQNSFQDVICSNEQQEDKRSRP